MTIAQVSIGLLRQHLPPGHRVHGIVTNGGQAANIVPEEVEGEFFVRAVSLEDLVPIEGRVRKCFEAGAVATGSSLQIEELSPPYSEFKADPGMACAYMRNAVKLGREFPPSNPALLMSTDMANVSLAIPAIHPMLAIGSLPAVNHQPEFARAAISPTGDQAIVDGAAAMAWTVIDLATTGERQRLVLNA
jgi:metal-dependent amidase/aminoacylase/carboxypeptidase family protein